MRSSKPDYDVIIAGAGPAGSSAAIHLVTQGARVLLVEQKKFPRPKLCGEFISPECLNHFERLGVSEQMLQAGGELVTQTVFYSRSGRSIKVPSQWFDNKNVALGLSRAEMDHRLLERARSVGAEIKEDTQASGLLTEGKRAAGVQLKSETGTVEATAAVVIDATGRARSLVHRVREQSRPQKASLVAFKAHLENARAEPHTCEIYSYPGGYGGLSQVENGLSNLCFIAAAKDVRECESDPETVMRKLVAKNSRAAQTLADARAHDQWLAVSLEGFGRNEPAPLDGLLTAGDSAAFIDPFTGSGMLMALEGGELAAQTILKHLPDLGNAPTYDSMAYNSMARAYREQYHRQFGSRLRVCAMLRRAAFVPRLADLAIAFFGLSERLRHSFAQATRAKARQST